MTIDTNGKVGKITGNTFHGEDKNILLKLKKQELQLFLSWNAKWDLWRLKNITLNNNLLEFKQMKDFNKINII